MRILLDENFPIQLHRRLVDRGHEAEHIILLGQRGCSDDVIRGRLEREELLFVTQDEDFMSLPSECRARILVSRVRQELPIQVRVNTWMRAIDEFFESRPAEPLFEVFDDGRLVPWRVHRLRPDQGP